MARATIRSMLHYGVYRESREQSVKLAVEWFDTHLKNYRPPQPVKN